MEKEVALFLVGTIVGGMNAVAGGGSLVGFPVLVASGLSPLVANATSNIVVLPGIITSVFGYRKFLKNVPKVYLLLAIPCVVGAIIGARLLVHTTPKAFTDLAPTLVLFAVLLFALQPYLHHLLHGHLRGRLSRVRPLAIIFVAMLPVAIYGGYFGAGIGFIMLAFFGFTKLREAHQINALKNIGSLCILSGTLAIIIPSGLIHWQSGLVMGAGSAVGGYFGSRAAQKISSHTLRVVVIIIGLCAAIWMAVRAYLQP